MIGTLKGTVVWKDVNTLVVDTGGVGYKVFSTTDTILDAVQDEQVFLWTYLAVRETALDLFGFLDRETLEIFELLITISGIGPKTALGILNVATPTVLRQAVASEDTSYLVKVGGIGKKNAEKIVLELKGKLVTTVDDTSTHMRGESDVMAALLSLGYNDHDVRDVLKKLPKDLVGTSERVTLALKLLSQAN